MHLYTTIPWGFTRKLSGAAYTPQSMAVRPSWSTATTS